MTIQAPYIDILEQLSSQGSVANLNALKKALRIWLILASIEDNPMELPVPFTYTQWHTAAIASNGLLQGGLNDVQSSSLADYLTVIGGVDQDRWIQEYCDRYNRSPEFIQQRLREQKPFELRSKIPENQKRSLEYDFLCLVEPGEFLSEIDNNGRPISKSNTSKQARYYRRTSKILKSAKSAQSYVALKSHVLNGRYKHVDLRELLVMFEQPIQQQQRFFLDLDNVVAIEEGMKVSVIAQFLKERVWPNPIVPPIQFVYHSRSQQTKQQIITYPICLYYYHRAPYLIGYGHSPQTHLQEITWYNFRAEQIDSPELLSWTDPNVPTTLQQMHKSENLPTPDHIINALESAWGFEMGAPKQQLLLRFVSPYHEQYIDRSNRHETFKRLRTFQEQQHYLNQLSLSISERQRMQAYLQTHSQDAYYRAIARDNDNGLVMRLRAWGPNVEVLYPFHLRDRMAHEIQQTYTLYQH